ncbi:Trp biosynthesis-associated membrane protein [Stackebrandtia soli]|uniref:Trp biosynthesis-associated membrane protein n=1 Tax=Stackebrandtia soli TaxID=1892856 RepID=UPI0039E80A4A
MTSTRDRSLPMAVVAGLASGSAALWAAGRVWSTTTRPRPAPLPSEEITETGLAIAGWILPSALVLLAASIAIFAVGGSLRKIVAIAIAAAGAATVAGGVTGLVGTPGVWPAIVLLSGVGGVIVAAWTFLRGARWPRMSARYDRIERPVALSDDPSALWDALDRGVDPSAPTISQTAPGEEYAR